MGPISPFKKKRACVCARGRPVVRNSNGGTLSCVAFYSRAEGCNRVEMPCMQMPTGIFTLQIQGQNAFGIPNSAHGSTSLGVQNHPQHVPPCESPMAPDQVSVRVCRFEYEAVPKCL